MSCSKQYWYAGYKTYSAMVPDSAQGAYFPGDEPGLRCEETRELCTDPDGVNPCECSGDIPTNMGCPFCSIFPGNDGPFLHKSGHGILFCPECGKKWTASIDL